MALHLVRHGTVLINPRVPSTRWTLDPDHEHDVVVLAENGAWDDDAVWFTSPEPKARRTALLLAGRHVSVVDDLREQDRGGDAWIEDFPATMTMAFAHPSQPARPGWESLDRTRDRVTGAVRRLLADHPGRDVVLVGHGTAWECVRAAFEGRAPDLERWQRLTMPDAVRIDTADIPPPSPAEGPPGARPLPAFRYQPDPIGVGSIVREAITCSACAKVSPYRYNLPVYSVHDVGPVCPWCIADSTVATRFDAFLNDVEGQDPPDDDALGVPPYLQVPDDVIETVSRRTPGFPSWQDLPWLVCCHDAMTYLGLIDATALRNDDVLRADISRDPETRDLLDHIGANLDCHHFHCPRCGHGRGLIDPD